MTRRVLYVFVGFLLVLLTLTVLHRIPNSEPLYDSAINNKPFCGLIAVATICSLRGIETNMSEVYKYTGVTEEGTSLLACKRALLALGLQCEAIHYESVADLPERVPILCLLRTEALPHAVVIMRRANDILFIDGQIVERFSSEHLDGLIEHMALVVY